MLTRREKLLILPWQERRWTQHRARVKTAVCAVDTQSPPIRPHVTVKLKKLQAEKDRLDKIQEDNLRLWRQLQLAGKTKRIDQNWNNSQPRFLGRVAIFKAPPLNKGQNRPAQIPLTYHHKSRKCLACERLFLPAV